jgi:hypothetical protein
LIARCTAPRPLAGVRGRLRKLGWPSHFIGGLGELRLGRRACGLGLALLSFAGINHHCPLPPFIADLQMFPQRHTTDGCEFE